MRKIFIGLAVLLAFLIAAVLILPGLVPASVYKSKIEDQISTALDREVEIAGDVGLSVFPTLRARADTVRIANASGFTADNFATMDNLEAGVKLIPLLSKKVEITKFTLINPEISLEKKANGEVNWAFGAPDQDKKVAPTTAFARDGRYTDLDISLGTFALENGKINFLDAQKGKNFVVENANLELSMPSLDQAVTAKGDLVFNSTPMDIDLFIDTPKSFLSGSETPFRSVLKSDMIDVSADGKFTASETITFIADFDSNIPSVSKLDDLLGIENPYESLTETAALKGNLSFDGLNLTAKNATVSITSDLITNNFQGDFVAGPAPSASGDLAVNIQSLSKLLDVLQIQLPQVDILETIDLKTSLSTNGLVTTGKNVVFTGTGELLDLKYTGNANFENALSLNGGFTVKSPSVPALVSKLNMGDVVPQTAVLGDLDITGKMSGLITDLTLSDINAATTGEDLTARYQGGLRVGETVSLNGTFDANGASVPAIVSKLGMTDLKAANVLGDFSVSGQASGTPGAMDVKGLKFKTSGSDFTGSYTGDVKIGEKIVLTGAFDALAPSVQSMATKAGLALPYANAIGKFVASGQLNGSTDALSIADLNAALTDGQINVKFDGTATTGDALSYAGNLSADIPSIRALAELGGTKLAPSTDVGQVYGPMSISGNATGNAQKAEFKNASISVDDLNGTGNFTADLAGSKPMVNGVLDMQGLDLRPYLAAMNAQRPKGKTVPWSKEPLNVSALNMFDADFTINTPNIRMTGITMDQSTIKSTIRNGVLKTNIPNAQLYGGKGNLDLEFNASSTVPQVAMDFTLNDVDGKGFLGAAANFTKLEGNTGTTMKIRGSGVSQDAIMRSLSGEGNFELAEGLVSGVDIGQFITNMDLGNLQSTLSQGALPSGIGPSYKTHFRKLAGLFTIKDGIVTVGDFALDGDNVLAEGAGSLDLGNQSVDFSLRPKLTQGKGLAAFGIPIRLKGNFGSIKAGLDSELLGKIVAEQAKARLTQEITGGLSNQVGGDLGGVVGGLLGTPKQPAQSPEGDQPAASTGDPITSILGDVIGGKKQPSPQQPTPASPTQQPTPQTAPEPAPKKPEDAVVDVLGGLLGSPSPNPPAQGEEKPEEKTEEEKKEEDPAEKLLKGLFGNDD
ncbi:MAG: AsmA family protein [Hyphomonadaceae bacterium]|nr:AsmA family protein [Hyphomonadaceae bacterium]